MQPCERLAQKLPRRLAVGRQCCTIKKPPFLDGEQLLASRASSPAAINGLVKWNPGLLGLPGASKNARSCGIKDRCRRGSRGPCRLAWPFWCGQCREPEHTV